MRIAALALLMCLCAMAIGCMGRVIAEDDAVRTDLPDIDPEDGVEREVTATLYYRLANEKYLVGVESGIAVRASERTETAVIRALMSGTPEDSGISPLFGPGVSLVDVSYEGEILYVTLSDGLLDESALSRISREDYQSDAEYQAAVEEAREELYMERRLGVLSIVNTITGNSDDDKLKVQLLVDMDGNGAGQRATYQELGFGLYDGELIEPLAFDEGAVATPTRVAECLLERIVRGEYEYAYALVAEGGKPSYSDFESELAALGGIASYSITGSQGEGEGVYVTADLRRVSPGGAVAELDGARLYMEPDGVIYRADYDSLKGIMEN